VGADAFERGFAPADGLNRMKNSPSTAHERGVGSGVDGIGASAAATPPEPVDTSGAVIRVMAVDDDDFMRELLHRVLAGAGMQVASCGSAAELLGAGDLASATVLLLDVNLPGMSGLDLQDLLRRRGIDLPIVFISGASDLGMAVTAMRNGAADFIEKPFQGALLIERVRRAVARHAADRVVARFETLTPREREVFDLLVTGMSSKLIARELGGSFRTIEIHRAQVMRKMTARHLPDLVRMSIESVAHRRVHAR
jgi:FixJ family two-component response regulator